MTKGTKAPTDKPRSAARRPKKASAKAPDCHSEDDLKALDRFCSAIEPLEDVSLESWEISHHDLDLNVPLWLFSDLAQQGTEHLVSYCRSLRASSEAPVSRSQASCLIQIPPASRHGDQILVKGQGDQLGAAHGDLRVTLHLKSR